MGISNTGYSHYVFMGVAVWVLLLCNIYIKSGLNRLDYFRWKLLVIETGLIGIAMGYNSLNQIINRGTYLEQAPMYLLVADVVWGFIRIGICLVTLYLAFNVRDKFRKT